MFVVAGGVTGEYSSSKTLSRTIEPSWNEEFKLSVKDPKNSQLECSLWDESSSGDTTQQKFLGEVILNLAKLVPHNNVLIEQVFEIKQGKQHKASADDKKATGKMKLGLRLSIPEEGGAQKAPSQPRANMSDSGATILVKLIKAEKLRTNIRGDPPDVMAKFRITGGCPPTRTQLAHCKSG